MTTTITSTAMTTSLIAKKLLLIAFGFGLLQELGVETLTGHQQLLNRSRELKSFREICRVKDEADAHQAYWPFYIYFSLKVHRHFCSLK